MRTGGIRLDLLVSVSVNSPDSRMTEGTGHKPRDFQAAAGGEIRE
jgi:hypothetical protein